MKYKISNSYLEVEIIDIGAELCSLKKINDSLEYIWQGNPEYWKRHAPILFPIVGKLINGIYTYEDKSYEISQHGFARDKVFSVEKHDKDNIIFKLTSDADALKIYPFEFELYLGYELKDKSLEISYKVVNKTNGEMLFSIGAHPAFNWPLENGKKEDYYFEFKDVSSLNTLPIHLGGIGNIKIPVEMDKDKIWLNEKVFEKDALIFDDLKTNYVAFKNRIDDRSVEVFFDGFPYIGLWSKPTGAPFICIEPWYGIADFQGHSQKLNEKAGINVLKEIEIFNASYIINI